jgi:menaquinol-cytochrome c reductase iron-sulfur subunit
MTDRRAFMKRAAAAAAACAALVAGIPALVAFTSPVFARKRANSWVKLGAVDRFEAKVPTKVDFPQLVNDAWVESRAVHTVWIYSDDGQKFNVYNPRCTHLGCSYAWIKERNVFECPCHYGVFDPKTGAVVSGPPLRPLDRLDSKIEDGVLYAIYQES